jgi:uncharacterized protein
VVRLCLGLDGTTLAIQGPPGSGKTYCAVQAILALVTAGKKVGVTANSHQVILGVLDKVCDAAPAEVVARVQHMGDADDLEDEHAQFPFLIAKDYRKVAEGLDSGRLAVVGGTSFAWTRDELAGKIDVLFVDEAGQLSLANVLAVSRAADSVVLVGDPAQLDQPTKGAHPPGAEASALEHLMGDAATLPEHLGVFLPRTRRLHPAICDFTSHVFYDGRLTPMPGLEARRIEGPAPFGGSGLRLVSVEHEGRTNRSDEEAERVADIVRQLLASGAKYHHEEGVRMLTARDILVVAPYNAQVGAIRERLARLDSPELAGDAVQVGTVDKFQGKEAPVVLYSMTTSSGDDAPRGLEFLYSLNRLNVATSRAQALVILVMNPALTGARCRTPRQMKLVNGLCAYLGRVG